MSGSIDGESRTSRNLYNVDIVSGGADMLETLRPLWHRLRDHHVDLSLLWRDTLLTQSFDGRREGLLAKSSGGSLLVLLAMSGTDPAAYCVATVTREGHGEIDSLFVEPAHRRRGIGRALVLRAMKWLRDRAASPVTVDVLCGNDDALRLYESAGFLPRTITLRHVPPGESSSEHPTLRTAVARPFGGKEQHQQQELGGEE